MDSSQFEQQDGLVEQGRGLEIAPIANLESESTAVNDGELFGSVLVEAKQLFESGTDWADFFKKILGLNGLIQAKFRLPEELNEFERSGEYAEIQRMLAVLRARSQETPGEPTKVITVRLPKSVHEALRAEAYSHRTSMNKLCISKLMQCIDDALIPEEV
jgi:predicted HicB family RNase H-like nuclease